MEEAFAAPTTREAVNRLLQGTAERLTDKVNPPRLSHGAGGAVRRARSAQAVKPELALTRAPVGKP